MAKPKAKATDSQNGNDRPDKQPRPFPSKSLELALKIPEQIRQHNNGNPWSVDDVAKACGYVSPNSSTFFYLASAARDYGLTIGTNSTEKIELAELGRSIVLAKNETEAREGKIRAFFKVDLFKKVYDFYGGDRFPEKRFLSNTLLGEFRLAPEHHDEFVRIFKENCKYLNIENGLPKSDKAVTGATENESSGGDIQVVGEPKGKFGRRAFVILPFEEKQILAERPKGFFRQVLNSLITPAGNRAGFSVETAARPGSDVIQSTIINELLNADLVICDLTDHNPSVLFELGIRIARELPVQLIRARGTPPIFDVDNMMRVMNYDPTLWVTALTEDVPELESHIRATWDNRARHRSYMKILTNERDEGMIQTASGPIPAAALSRITSA